jgi:hypothetical protein
MTRQPKIDEIVAFLEKNAPNSIEKIRDSNPSFKSILKSGEVLGNSTDTEELKVRANVCLTATDAAIKICNDQLVKLKSRLKGSQKIGLWGQIVTTIGSASVITTLAAKLPEMAYVGGGLGLAGALVPIIIEQRNKGLDKNKQLDETYTDLIKFKLEAERNAQELNFFVNNNFNVDGISSVINRCNQLCSDIMERQLLS